MKSRRISVLVGVAVAGLVLSSGCGSAGSGDSSSAAPTVSGVVSSDLPANSVALRDASDPMTVRIVTPGADGSFSFDAAGLAPPFVLKAEGVGPALYTIVLHPGNADINGLTSAAVAGATSGKEAGEAWSGWGERDGDDGEHGTAGRIGSVIRSLRTVLAPLFDLYHVGRIGGDDDEGDVSGMRALLRDVSVTVSNGVVTVTNRATGGIIFSAPLNDLASGVFHPENMPAGPGGSPPPPPSTCTGFTYSAWTPATCPASGQQTRTVVSATPAGCTGGNPMLTQTCTYVPPPPPPSTCTGFTYSAWTPATCPASGQQTRTVVSATPAGCTGGNPVLTQACTYVPPPPAACTYTYSAWGACQPDGTQTRTVVSATPAGCTGTPVLTQACTYTPPIDGAALYQQSCSSCHGSLASSNLKGKMISVSMIKSRGMTQGLTDAQLQAIVTAVGP